MCIKLSCASAIDSTLRIKFGNVDLTVLQGLLEVMASAGQVGGPSAEVSTLLAVCIRDSLESAFQWHIEQTAKDADSDAQRICILAKAIVNLLGIEVTTFSPVIAPYLPIAADVAAKALHELFGSQLLPWLATGNQLPDIDKDAHRFYTAWGLQECATVSSFALSIHVAITNY